ncbi:hypothetical protein Tco_0955279 [Tanacetum coccineum]|uniref:Reverse transcriptase domain-containing protein n=1 Tax=Tanacetum coccineum TaxID=301880 RepID=A0ABQ5E6R3_9ASTR
MAFRKCMKDAHIQGFFRSAEEAYALAELPPGESRGIHRRLSFPAGLRDVHQRLTFPPARRDDRDGQNNSGKDFRKGDYRNSYKGRDNFNLKRKTQKDNGAPYPQRERTNRPVPVLSLDSLTKCPKEILATETQLHLPPPRPVANPLRTMVERRQNRNPPVQKIINMVSVHSSKKKKRKDREATESWMNTHISFPSIMTMNCVRRTTIIGIRGQKDNLVGRPQKCVRRSSVKSVQHCFENLPKKVKAGLRETRTDLVGFAGEVSKPLGKIDLEREEKQMKGKKRPKKMRALYYRAISCQPQLSDQMVTIEMKTLQELYNASWIHPTKGYHKSKWRKEDEEKTAFLHGAGKCIWLYEECVRVSKEPVAHLPRQVTRLPSQIGKEILEGIRRTDMVIKSKEETGLLADIAETFEGLKTINMKLNPKKCSFGVEEGKFLGYMVTSEGIRANPKKTKAISDLQSPKTLKEMQSLSGKLASLNRFLAKSVEEELSFSYDSEKHNEGEQARIPMDRGGGRGFSADEETDHVASIVDTTLPGRNVIRIPSVKVSPNQIFLSDAPDGEREDEYFQSPEVPPGIDDTEAWTLYTDGASSSKGSGAGLVLTDYWGSCKAAGQDNGEGNNPLRDWTTSYSDMFCHKNHCHRQWGTTDQRPLQESCVKFRKEKSMMGGRIAECTKGHRTSIQASNGETPFSLTLRSEASFAEIGMPSYRTLMIREEFNEEEQRLNLDLLQERREAAAIREARYKSKMEQYYNKKVRPAGFRPGEFVYRRM